MGVIQTLRNKGGKISIIVIGLALFMFLVQDALSGRNSIFRPGGDDNYVGSVDGEKIEYKDFEIKAKQAEDLYVERNPQATVDENLKEGLRSQVWQDIVNDKVLMPQYKKAGIDVTGQEIYEMCTNEEYANEVIRNAFADPKTRIFDVNTAKNFLKQLDNDDENAEKAKAQWLPFEKEFTKIRIAEKYNAMAKAGMYVTSLEARNLLNEGARKVNFQFVSQQYANFNDSTVKVSADEVKAYYSNHKDKYKRDAEERKLAYIYFDFVPSSTDTADVIAWGSKMAAGFMESKNDSLYVIQNLGSWDATAKGHGSLDPKIEDSLFSAPIGKVIGPYSDNGIIKVAKLVGIKEDSTTYYRASHILVKPAGSTAKDTADAYAKAADYMNQIKSGKKTFEEMARLYGTDGTAAKGGDLGWFGPGAMVKDFEDGVKRTPYGQMSIVKSQFGIHIVKVTAPPSRKKIVVAQLNKKIQASQTTIDAAYNNVAALASESHDYISFADACKKRNIAIRTADLNETNRSIQGLTNSKALVSWAFRAKKDEVSQLYTMDEKYVIGVMKDIFAEGTMKPEEITDLEATALRDKKAQILIAKFKENMKNATTPEQLAISFGSVAQNIQNQTFASPYIEYIGNEPAILAAVFATPKQKFSEPIQGTNGVYVVYVNDVVDAPAPEAQMIKSQQDNRMMQAKGQVESFVTEALKNKFKVKDLRYRF